MLDPPFSIVQNIFKAPHSPILVTTCPWVGLNRNILCDFLDTADGTIGVAPAYGQNCVLSALAFASTSKVLLVRMPKWEVKLKTANTQGGELLEEFIFCASSQKFAFQMDVLSTSLFIDLGLRLCGGVDLLSVATDARHSRAAILDSMGGVGYLNARNAISLFEGTEEIKPTDVALQAWVAWRAATLGAQRLIMQPRIDTIIFAEPRLSVLAKIVRDACRLDALKPTWVRNEIANDYDHNGGELHVLSTRFKNRVRLTDQRIEIHGMDQGRPITVSGNAKRVDGRSAHIELQSNLPSGKIEVTTVGREPPNGAERQRTEITLKALQATSPILDRPFFRAIWLPHEPLVWPAGLLSGRTAPIHFPRQLNESQKTAVEAILSSTPVNIIHGPPGTGKTTVIAAAVTSLRASASHRTVWLVAQSNVAVKNIAEKLASVNFLDFKLLVSIDFHYDWCDHPVSFIGLYRYMLSQGMNTSTRKSIRI
ncbi:hypothetical protein B0H17DRAFT_522634 [Mycena rosella]|uniref:DNA2/NAM7 helicase helicase domain-containing protein n=1 Tax=Mycena rosella TaxID=1033263 RepID=A0AAD7GXX1_MYCRO|nr:hypothetical protein B0H17DRAFT_522634 [Mycena rosella]